MVRTGMALTPTITCPTANLPWAGLPALTVSTLAPLPLGASDPATPSQPCTTRLRERRSSATPTTSWLGRNVAGPALPGLAS